MESAECLRFRSLFLERKGGLGKLIGLQFSHFDKIFLLQHSWIQVSFLYCTYALSDEQYFNIIINILWFKVPMNNLMYTKSDRFYAQAISIIH